MTDKRRMELTAEMSEMLCLGWTPETFDDDFDKCESDAWIPDEKEECREIFKNLWKEREDDVLDTKINGVEWCGCCDTDFEFSIVPREGIKIVCPNCGTEQNPCSLCNHDICNCSENRCKFWIVNSIMRREW